MIFSQTEDNRYQDSVVYHIYLDSFCDGDGDGVGDVAGVRSKLDYLHSLGCNTLLVEGIYSRIRYLEGVPTLGEQQAEFAALLTEAQERDMYVLIDMPIACTPVEHPWFALAAAGDDRYADYYVWSQGNADGKRAPDAKRIEGVCRWAQADNGLWYRCIGTEATLNWASPALRDDVASVALYWLGLGVDGFVWDVRSLYAGDDKGAAARYRAVQALAEAVKAQAPAIIVIKVGDADCNDLTAIDHIDGVTATSHLPINKPTLWHRKPNPKRFKQALGRWQSASFGRYLPTLYLENAELPRCIASLGGDYGDFRKEAATCYAAAIGLLRGVPCVYQGQEIGMTDYPIERLSEVRDHRYQRLAQSKLLNVKGPVHDMVLRAVSRTCSDHARQAMQWTGLLPNAGYSASREPFARVNPNYTELNVQSAMEDEASTLYFFRNLYALRSDKQVAPALKYGTYHEYYPASRELYVYTRSYKGTVVMVICNLVNAYAPFAVPDRIAFNEADLLLHNYDMPAHLGNETLRPYECVVYRLK